MIEFSERSQVVARKIMAINDAPTPESYFETLIEFQRADDWNGALLVSEAFNATGVDLRTNLKFAEAHKNVEPYSSFLCWCHESAARNSPTLETVRVARAKLHELV